MKTIPQLYQPTPNGNPFYQLALAADFSGIESIGEIRTFFDNKLSELVTETETGLAPLTSVTQVAETLHYSAMAAGLLQVKAMYRHETLKSSAPPEQSVANSVLMDGTCWAGFRTFRTAIIG